jgi:hypothetical protein
LRRLQERVGPPAPPRQRFTPEELVERFQLWLGRQTGGGGVFHDDPAFGPVWSHYYTLWCRHSHGWWPLHAVWKPCPHPEVEAARQEVLPIMVRVLQRQPRPVRFLGDLLGALVKVEAGRRPDAVGIASPGA